VERAIELNGEAVAMNLAAFRWGRRAAHEPDFVNQAIAGKAGGQKAHSEVETLDEMLARRVAFLTAYQNASYAGRYASRVARIRESEAKAVKGSSVLAETVARNLFKLMAMKDEYEVARLYTDGSFKRQLEREFESHDRLEFHLAPPVLGRKGSDGKPRKSNFGPWMMRAFRLLAVLKGLRGTPFDVFGRTAERRRERQLLAEYEADLDLVESRLTPATHQAAAALAAIPALVRGYGHVREASMKQAAAERQRILQRWTTPAGNELQAAE